MTGTLCWTLTTILGPSLALIAARMVIREGNGEVEMFGHLVVKYQRLMLRIRFIESTTELQLNSIELPIGSSILILSNFIKSFVKGM